MNSNYFYFILWKQLILFFFHHTFAAQAFIVPHLQYRLNSSCCSSFQKSKTSSSDEKDKGGSKLSTSSADSRSEQIKKIQGIWWTSPERNQLVEINSSYAIFDIPNAFQDSNSPAILYPLGGTNEVVTLRTCKLLSTSPTLQWSSSPTSKHQETISCWEKCANPDEHWKSDCQKIIPGYEKALVNYICGGPVWHASPVDVVRSCIRCVQNQKEKADIDANVEILEALCNEGSNSCIKQITELGSIMMWSIVKCNFQSPDICTLLVKISCGEIDQFIYFCLSRVKRSAEYTSKLPTSLIYNTPMDIDLYLNGKVWMLEKILNVPWGPLNVKSNEVS